MTFNIDLNDYSGGPHWLSAKGKVNREAIYAKHHAKYLAERVRAIKSMSPEPSDQLEMIFDHAKDPLHRR
jgi:hypothetical protein